MSATYTAHKKLGVVEPGPSAFDVLAIQSIAPYDTTVTGQTLVQAQQYTEIDPGAVFAMVPAEVTAAAVKDHLLPGADAEATADLQVYIDEQIAAGTAVPKLKIDGSIAAVSKAVGNNMGFASSGFDVSVSFKKAAGALHTLVCQVRTSTFYARE